MRCNVVVTSQAQMLACMPCRCNHFLQAAAQLAREQWTQFNVPLMALGLALFTATLLLQASALWISLPAWPRTHHRHQPRHNNALVKLHTAVQAAPAMQAHLNISGQSWGKSDATIPARLGASARSWGKSAPAVEAQTVTQHRPQLWHQILPTGAVMLSGLHAAGLFSTSFILSEGQMVCFLVASLGILLLHSGLANTLHQVVPELTIKAAMERPRAAYASEQWALGKRKVVSGVGSVSDKVAVGSAQFTSSAPIKSSSSSKSERGSSRQQCSSVLLWGMGLLVCNALLASAGLVTRTGHDAMHKAAADVTHSSSDALRHAQSNNSSAQFFSTASQLSVDWLGGGFQHTQELLAPIFCVMLFPLVLLGDAQVKSLHDKQVSTMSSAMNVSVWLAYLAVALLWVCQTQQIADLSLMSFLESVLPTGILPSLVDVLSSASQAYMILITFLSQPLNVLLPRTCFVFSSASLTLHALLKACGYVEKSNKDSSNTSVVVAAVSALILLVLGSASALTAATGLMECVCITQLFKHLHCDHNVQVMSGKQDNTLRSFSAWISLAEGSTWALIAMQLFFCTGHFCEFAGLQYSSGKCHFACIVHHTEDACSCSSRCCICNRTSQAEHVVLQALWD